MEEQSAATTACGVPARKGMDGEVMDGSGDGKRAWKNGMEAEMG